MTTIECGACGLPLAVETTTCPICGSPDRNIDVHDAITMVDEVAVLADVVEAVREPGATVAEHRELAEILQQAADEGLTVEQTADRIVATKFSRFELWLRKHQGKLQALTVAVAVTGLGFVVADHLAPDSTPPPETHIVNNYEIHVELPENPTEDQIRGFMRQELRRLLDEGTAG